MKSIFEKGHNIWNRSVSMRAIVDKLHATRAKTGSNFQMLMLFILCSLQQSSDPCTEYLDSYIKTIQS